MRYILTILLCCVFSALTLDAQNDESAQEKGPDYRQNVIQRSNVNPQKPYRSWNLSAGIGLSHPGTDVRYRNIFGARLPKNENQYSLSLRATKMFSADLDYGLRLNMEGFKA